MKLIHKIFFLLLNLFIIHLFVFFSAASAENMVSILVLPFNIHAEQDLTFLQKGIGDMLSSRLTIEGKTTVISQEEMRKASEALPETINEETALSLGSRLYADYVLMGSLTVFGNSISTDAKFIDVHNKTPVIIFNQLGKSRDDVISHVNLFAGQINETIFGHKTATYQPSQPSLEPEKEAETRRHPDKLWTDNENLNVFSSGASPAEGEASFSLWKSRKFNTKIGGTAIGDVFGDGNNEIVFISDSKIFIYRFIENRFNKVKEIQAEPHHRLINIDVADINNNGKSEIFLSSISEDYYPRSFVLEWNGTEFKHISEEPGWYYRVMNLPEHNTKMLLGQKGGIRSIFSGNIYELKWNGTRYEPQDKQVLPKWINIYSFAYGDILNSGQKMIVAFQRNDSINIMEMNGTEEWTGSEFYGGRSAYLVAPSDAKAAKKASREGDAMATNRLYLSQRILIADLDKDGKKEAIVVKNHDTSRRIFSRVRMFDSGHFESLEWDNVGLRTKWKTRKFSGYISDYAIGDLNNDGRQELVFALNSKGSLSLGSEKSYIVSMKID